jgi:3-hydroxy-9,10-secoandrosta-1,3,5(10)-triene-9,17-dione monooxygenase
VSDIYTGTAPGAALHDADTYRWPMVPALALLAAKPALGSAEWAADIYAGRLSERVLAYEGVMHKDKPIAQAHLAEAQGQSQRPRQTARPMAQRHRPSGAGRRPARPTAGVAAVE